MGSGRVGRSRTFDSGIILVHEMALNELNGECGLADTYNVALYEVRTRKCRKTHHHHRQRRACTPSGTGTAQVSVDGLASRGGIRTLDMAGETRSGREGVLRGRGYEEEGVIRRRRTRELRRGSALHWNTPQSKYTQTPFRPGASRLGTRLDLPSLPSSSDLGKIVACTVHVPLPFDYVVGSRACKLCAFANPCGACTNSAAHVALFKSSHPGILTSTSSARNSTFLAPSHQHSVADCGRTLSSMRCRWVLNSFEKGDSSILAGLCLISITVAA